MGTASATASTSHLPGTALRLLSDERLAKRAAAGEPAAFALIFERHHQGIYRYCRSMLGHEDASDALQSTMAAALRSLPGERREIALKPWLYRVAHNESVSLIRRRRPSAELPEDLAAEGGPQQQAESRERLAALAGDLRELPERQSGALVMRELSGLGYDEIGATFSISEAAAKQSVYNARAALAQFAEGREMRCEPARQALSGRDGRVLRSLKLRAHLRHCEDCATFKAAVGERRANLSALAPPIAPAAAAALLDAVMHGGGGASGGGLLALLSGSAGKVAGGGAALKASAAVGITLAVGVGAATVGGLGEAAQGAGEEGRAARVERAHARGASRPDSGGAVKPAGRDPQADERRRSTADGNDREAGERGDDAPPSTGQAVSNADGGAAARGGAGTGPAGHTPGTRQAGARTPSSGPPVGGGPASEPGRETARRYAPAGLPAPAQRYLGGDGQGDRPEGSAPSALPVPTPPVPRAVRVPGR